MKEQIKRLNRQFVAGEITAEVYRDAARKLLQCVDWMHRIQFENMLFVTYGK